MKVVVIGGVAAGMAAAARLKRNLKDGVDIMDLCYSPPFSGVWDAALIASNTAK